MDALNQRIQAIVEASGHSARAFAKRVGVSSTGLQHVLNGRNRPGADLLTGIPRAYPGVSASWLLIGEGQPFSHSPIDEPAGVGFRTGDFADPAAPNRGITTVPLRFPSLPAAAAGVIDVPVAHLYIPAVAQRSYAVGFTGANHGAEGVLVLNLPFLRKPGRTFEVADDSMAPVFAEGDYVVCKRIAGAKDVREERVYVLVSATVGVSVGYVRPGDDHLLAVGMNRQHYSPVRYELGELRELWEVEWHVTRRFLDPIAPWRAPGVAQQVDEIRAWLGHKFPDFPAGA